MSQLELETNTYNQRHARENACNKVSIDFDLVMMG